MATEERDIDGASIDPEVLPPETHLVRTPAVPTTVDELAAHDEGQAIIEARVVVLETLRRASIRATNPQDWLLFKAVDPSGGPDRITAFLQDQGCKRILPLWGIDITPTSGYEKTTDTNTGDFAYSIRGDGFCSMTKRSVKDIEGLRYSTDRFLDGLTAIVKEMRVKQATRSNMDGNITRKLTGLSNVAIEEIQEAWKGTWKTIDLCPKGKGYGTKEERAGSADRGAPKLKPPMCERADCGKEMKFWAESRDGKMPACWRCPEYNWNNSTRTSNGHSRITAADYEKQMASAANPENGQREPAGDRQ